MIAAMLFLLSAATFPNREFLPPPLPWRGTSEALVARPDHPWITPAEKTGLTDTPNYEETIEYLKRLAAASRLISMHEFGRTAQGRPLYVVIAGEPMTKSLDTFKTGDKPSLLAQAGLHSGEIDGKDAGMMLLRDIAFGGKEDLLEQANFLFVPAFNADGHERSSRWNRPNQRGPQLQGWRTTAQNLNLNRDYMKADSPEMQAMLTLINKTSPSLYLDIHVTDGIDYQYDITFGYHGESGVPAYSKKIGEWLDQTFRPAAYAALEKAGHFPGRLVFAKDDRAPEKGLLLGPAMPRFSHGYGDLRHLPTILVENHSLKPYRQRVLGTYVLLEAALRVLGGRGSSLGEAIAADQKSRPATLPTNWADGEEKIESDFLGIDYELYDSPASGGKEVRWLGRPKVYPKLPMTLSRPTFHLKRPAAYWVPVTKPEVITRLKLHGIQMEVLTQPKTVKVEMYRLKGPQPATAPSSQPFEGRHTRKTSVTLETREEAYAAGSVRISTDQPLGDLAVALLEPECLDSLFGWGFFPEILQRTEYIEGYAVAALAEQMLADHPVLKTEFEAKLAKDSALKADPNARLRWFYEQSPFYDDRYLLYPVGLERFSSESD